MKVLVLESDSKERAGVQKVLERLGHTFTPIETSEQALPMIQAGDARFLIGNWDTSDLRPLQFIQRARAAKLSPPLYILLITEKKQDEDLTPAEVDDILHKPFSVHDLKTRIAVGERIISLAQGLAEARNQLDNLAMFDNLTGMLNRAAFYRQSVGELERARRASVPLSLIALDIDNFKNINEAHGTEGGDVVLRVVAQTIREKSRPYDCIGRWSGDEFVIMLSGVIGADAEKIAERIIAGVRTVKIEVENAPSLSVKMSSGIASASRISASSEVEPLIQQARQAMSRAKEAGGNQVYLAYV
jgi:diguanylate cyclase (GGDEF)-like protein